MENNFLPLFQPLQIGNLILKNCLVMAPMGENYGGRLQNRSIEYYARRAKGGVGMVTTGAIVSNSVTRTTFPHLTDTETIFNTAYLAEAVHAGGAALCVEFTAGAGRNAPDPTTGKCYSASDDVDGYWTPGVKCVQLTVEQIHQIMKETQETAAKCKAAGVDCITIHTHNGYLIDQFLSSGWNHRTDEYGGITENRMRFLTEYLQAISEGVGPGFPIIIRFIVDMLTPGVRQPGETEEILKLLKALDFQGIDVDWACYECADKIFPSYYEEDACELYVADKVRELGLTMPIFNAGNHTPETALKAVTGGKADAILLGRALIADPDLPNKLLHGARQDILPCLKCNVGCLARQPGRGISCAVNPEVGTEERAKQTVPCENQKVVIIGGGGLSGCEMGLELAEAGKQVTIIEMRSRFAADAAAFNGMTLLTKLSKLGVKLCADTKVKRFTAEGVAAEKDGDEMVFPADTIVHAFGIRPNSAFAAELTEKYPGIVTTIGDSKRIGCIYDAVHGGYHAAMSLE